ncbi:phage baseplate assembly protein V [Cellvibrio mixtus]|uniref:phage baseplate assembly protein V n=1 Tax=Cellvibrio mixtus TaxID=39650 RepID=UPI000586F0F2|nr:phage baseplate assembly protein V [Cellvibrio mixtus]
MIEPAEILRLLHNLIRLGTVAEVQYQPPRVRVKTGDNETDWLHWLNLRAATTADWDPPIEGEQVILFSPAGDLAQAIAVTGIYSDQFPAPSDNKNLWLRKFPDGSTLSYDHAENRLDINIKGDANIHVEKNATVKIDQDLTAKVGGAAKIDVEMIAQITAPKIELGKGGAGVVTGKHLCAYTQTPHADFSKIVTAE